MIFLRQKSHALRKVVIENFNKTQKNWICMSVEGAYEIKIIILVLLI